VALRNQGAVAPMPLAGMAVSTPVTQASIIFGRSQRLWTPTEGRRLRSAGRPVGTPRSAGSAHRGAAPAPGAPSGTAPAGARGRLPGKASQRHRLRRGERVAGLADHEQRLFGDRPGGQPGGRWAGRGEDGEVQRAGEHLPGQPGGSRGRLGGSGALPAAVRATRRRSRSNSAAPRSRSRPWIALDTADCTTWSRRAPRVNESSSATATKYSRCRSSICPISSRAITVSAINRYQR